MPDLLAICLIAVTLGVVAWQRMPLALALFTFLLPVYQVRFSVFGFPTTALEVMFLALLAVWVVRRFLVSQKRPSWPWRTTTAVLLIAGLLAVVVSPDRWAGLGLYRAYLLEPIIFFSLVVDTIRSERSQRLVLIAMSATTAVLGLAALLQFLHLVPGVEPYVSQIPARATAVFSFPTAVGKYVGPLCAFFLALLVVRKQRTDSSDALQIQADRGMRLLAFGTVLLGIAALVFSISRGALIGVAAAAVTVGFFSRFRKWIWIAFMLGAVLVAVMPATRTMVSNVIRGSDVSTDVRLVMWEGTFRLIKDRPLFGAGLAGFPLLYPQYKEASHTEFFPNPDNLILTLWVELGLLGMLAFFAVLIQFIRRILPALRMPADPSRPLAVALLAMLVAFFVHGFLDTPYFKNDLAMLFWVFAGLAELLPRTGQMR